MAVEKAKVIARIKALFPKINLSVKRLDAIADKLSKKPADDADEAAIDAVINDFNDVLSFEDIAKEDDRARTLEADKKKAEEAAKKKANSKSEEEEEEEEEEGDEIPADTPAWAKALIKSNKTLKADLDSIKSGKVLETKGQTARKVFDGSEVFKNASEEVKEFMFKNIDLNSETSFEDQVKGLEETFGQMVQKTADETSYPGPAGSGKSTTGVDEKEVERLVNEM